MHYKFPRTFHLPFSLGLTTDDRRIKSVKHFEGKEILVTEKLDGENTSFYLDHIHARSLDSGHHPSRTYVKILHSEIKHDIPKGFRICGENVQACHSIVYRNLEAYFYVFGIYDDKNFCLSWDETVEYANLLGLKTVPVLYRGLWDEEKVKACWIGESVASPGDQQEGYVIRVAEGFPYDQQDECTAKMVRENHVQTSEHWMNNPVIPNLLRL